MAPPAPCSVYFPAQSALPWSVENGPFRHRLLNANVLVQISYVGGGLAIILALTYVFHIPFCSALVGNFHSALDIFEGLQEEYRILRHLGRVLGTGAEGYAKRCLLMINLRWMTLWFTAVHRFRFTSAKSALAEMSAIVEYFAEALCRRSSARTTP